MDIMQKMEKDLNTVVKQILKSCKVQSVEEVSHALLMKPSACTKDALASFVEKLLKLSTSNVEFCHTAAMEIDQLKSERIAIQQTVIDLQQKQLQQVQATVEASVKDSVKTEISTWSDIVKNNVKTATQSAASVQKAVRSAVQENVRSNNFIIYGAEEEGEDEYGIEQDNVANITNQLFNEIGAFPKPQVLTVSRVGFQKADGNNGSSRPKPIKVTLASPEAVKFVLSKASKLKRNKYDHWKCVYLAPDRSKDERAAHSKLVAELKQKISEDSSKYHYIRDGKITSIDKALSTAGTPATTTSES